MKLVLVGVVARYDTAMRLNRKVAKLLAGSVGMEAVAEMTARPWPLPCLSKLWGWLSEYP